MKLEGKKKVIALCAILMVVVISTISIFAFKKDKDIDPELAVARGYQQVQPGDEAVDGTEFVQFDAYYLRDLDGDGYAEKLRGTCREIGTQDTLYMDLNVLTNGTLKDAKITIDGKNFYFATALVKDNVLSKDYIGTNTKELVLKDVSNGTQKLIFGMVQSGDYSVSLNKANAIKNNINNYSVSNNTVTLTGIHVSDDGTETPISKTVELTNDWYGTTRTEFYMPSYLKKQEYDISNSIDTENQKFRITFKLEPLEKDAELLLYKNYFECELPLINGYAPEEAYADKCTSSSYNSDTRIFKAEKSSDTKNGNVINKISRDNLYEVTAVYPLEAFNSLGEDAVALNIPISSYYQGYNNDNFSNPYKSNVAQDIISAVYKNPEGENARVDVYIGKYTYDEYTKTYKYIVSKQLPVNRYNQLSSNNEIDKYIVNWHLYTGSEAYNKSVKLVETPESYTDKFVDVNNQYIDMERYVSNIGIYFTGAERLLGTNGYINVYNDENNELIHTFTKADWNRYSQNQPYMYESGIKHIRVETSEVEKNSSLDVYHVKQIDDVVLTADFTKEEFDALSKIYSYVTAYMDGEKLDNDINYANYEEPYSIAKITIDPQYISNQETAKASVITIESFNSQYDTIDWENGEFLIEYPQDIIDVNIKNIESSNGIEVSGFETYEENGRLYTKIYTSNKVAGKVLLKMTADITADPRGNTSSENINMYYYNPFSSNYRQGYKVKDTLDMNENGNTDEYVGISKATLNIIAPSNLLTSQTARNYDDNGSVVVAPEEAIVDKDNGERTATIDVNLTNNYSGTISEIKIVGKIPYEGNKYQINSAKLGSMFDTTMSNEGIYVPNELKSTTTVYYSTKENVTDDINNTKNGWTTTVEDMSKVKSYLIDLGEYVLPVSETKTFSYNIEIPNGLDLNKVSYSAHAVYYCLDTEEGKLKTQTEPNKLGFRIAEKYDLEINKLELNSDKTISGTIFNVIAEGEEESKIASSNSNGIATFKNLYAEKIYSLKEIKSNPNYVLRNDTIKFIAHITDSGLQFEVLDGSFDSDISIINVENENTKVNVTLENEIKYKLDANKVLLGTEENIKGIKFILKDYNNNFEQEYTTDANGKLNLPLLEPNCEYELRESNSLGHYILSPIKFVMIRDSNGELSFNLLSGEFNGIPQIIYEDEIPVVKVKLENEKIPTYSLKITKKESDTETIIPGAQFVINGENKDNNVLYTTDENGNIVIEGLYQYIEGKNATGEYTLKEIYATPGYVINVEPLIFKLQKNATDNYEFNIISGTIREDVEEVYIDQTDVNNPVVNITIDNSPAFTLTKLDAKTNEPMEGVAFVIKDLDGNIALDVSGNPIGTTEISEVNMINMSEQYKWMQNGDDTWESGAKGVGNGKSSMFSEEFEVKNGGTLYFDWSVSSESGYDKLYYELRKEGSSTVIGGESKAISGTNSGTVYENLIFSTQEIELTSGKWTLTFTYKKDGSANRGLDKGYVKNIYFKEGAGIVKTDANGIIKLNLKEGLYKAYEIETLEGYKIEENYIGIGIGESKPAEQVLIDAELNSKVGRYKFVDAIEVDDGVIVLSEDGRVIKHDGDLNTIWENSDYYGVFEKIVKADDGFYVVGYYNRGSNILLKYDYDGNIIWKAIDTSFGKFSSAIAQDDGVIVAGTYNLLNKYDKYGNLIWEVTGVSFGSFIGIVEHDDYLYAVTEKGSVVKYTLDGELAERCDAAYRGDSEFDKIASSDSGIVLMGSKEAVKIDYDCNVCWEVNDYPNYSFYYIDKYGDYYYINGSAGGSPEFILVIDEDGNVIYDWYYSGQYGYATSSFGNQLIHYSVNNNIKIFDLETMKVNKSSLHLEENRVNYFISTDNYIYAYDSYAKHMLKIDENAQIVQKRYYGDNYFAIDADAYNNEIYVIVKKSSQSIVSKVIKYDEDLNEIATYTDLNLEGLYISDNGDFYGLRESKIVRLDENFNILWEDSYLLDNDIRSKSIRATNDGIVISYWKSEAQKVVKIDKNDNIKCEFEFDGNYSTNRLSSLGESAVLVTTASDDHTDYVYFIDKDGNVIYDVVENLDDNYIRGIVRLEDSFIIFTDANMIKYDYEGNRLWVKKVAYTVSAPYYIDGKIMVTTYSNRITIYDTDGNKISTSELKNPPGGLMFINNEIVGVGNSALINYEYVIKEPAIPDSQNVVVYNEMLKYNITTKVDGAGGTISGAGETPYETVIYKEDSTKDIVATPMEGYRVEKITVNDEEIDFITNEDHSVKLDKFVEMTEDKEIVVSFVKIDESLKIKKIDENTGLPLSDAIIKIEEIDEREIPNKDEIIGEIIKNGPIIKNEEYSNLGETIDYLTEENINTPNEYGFDYIDGTLVSNNKGVHNSTANSYIEIDLTESSSDRKYLLEVGAMVSSESYDIGYVTITENSIIPSCQATKGRLIYVNGNETAFKNYMQTLDGGKKYYLHMGYYKDSSANRYNDEFIINKINLKEVDVNVEEIPLNFEESSNGTYVSNNQNIENSTAKSCFPIDLRGKKGYYTLKLDVSINGSAKDFGCAYISSSTYSLDYDYVTHGIFKVSGQNLNKEYAYDLEGGKLYYLHVEYQNGEESDSTVSDDFTINSMDIVLNPDRNFKVEYTTNEEGIIIAKLNPGKYRITEVRAPEGYTLDNSAREYTFVSGIENEIVITNKAQEKVIVHHYIKGTTTKVADDEEIKGDLGKEYTTHPKTDIPRYQLVKNEDGSYQIPDNATGVYTDETQVITYYYEEKPVRVIVHHLEEGTDEKLVEDKEYEYERGSSYSTNPITVPELDDIHTLITDRLPENASGIANEDVIEVTYYYSKLTHKITTEVIGGHGNITGKGMEAYELVPHGEMSRKDIFVEPDENYIIDKVIINGVEYKPVYRDEFKDYEEYAEQRYIYEAIWEQYEYILEKFNEIEEDIHIQVKFKPEEIKVYVYKIWLDNHNESGLRPESFAIDVYNGDEVLSTYELTRRINECVEGGLEYYSIESITPLDYYLDDDIENEYPDIYYNDAWAKVLRVPTLDENGNRVDMDDITFVERELNEGDLRGYKSKVVKFEASYNGYNAIIENELYGYEISTEVDGIGGNISGQDKDVYEVVPEESDSRKPIIIKPDYGYVIDKITINGVEQEYEFDGNTTEYTLPQFINVTEDKHVVVKFKEYGSVYKVVLNKVNAFSNEIAGNAKFNLSTIWGESKIVVPGTFELNNVYENIDYTLVETKAPNLYVLNNQEITFHIDNNGDEPIAVITSGQNVTTSTTLEAGIYTISINIPNKPDFILEKYNEDRTEKVPGAKFIIQKVKEDLSREYITDSDNNILGTLEEIDGVEYYTFTTNENGEIGIPLESGKYVAIEVQAPEGYVLPENEADRTYEFEIEASEEQHNIEVLKTGDSLSRLDYLYETLGVIYLEDGMIVYGGIENTTIPGQYTASGESITVNVAQFEDGVVLKLNNEGKIEWIEKFDSSLAGSSSMINSLAYNSKGECIVTGIFMGTLIIPGEKTVTGEAMQISAGNEGKGFTLITDENQKVKYFEIDKLTKLSFIYNNQSHIYEDGSYEIDYNNLNLSGEDGLYIPGSLLNRDDDLMVQLYEGNSVAVMYDSNNNPISAKVKYIYSNNEEYGPAPGSLDEENSRDNIMPQDLDEYNEFDDCFEVVKSLIDKDGNRVFVGFVESSFHVPAYKTVNGEEIYVDINGSYGAVIYKVNSNDEIIWLRNLGSTGDDEDILYIYETEDSYATVGYCYGNLYIPAEKTVLGEDITIEKGEEERTYLFIIYDFDGLVKYVVDLEDFITVEQSYRNNKIRITKNGNIYNLENTNENKYIVIREINEDALIEDVVTLMVNNEKIKYNITTEVVGGHGQISGENDEPYEKVKHGNDSTKDIIMTPENGYKISSITVNDVPVEFTANEDGTYTLPKFENVTEDKHVIVTYEQNATSIVVKHQTEDGEDLKAPETIDGVVGEHYTTEPEDFDNYDVKVIPTNKEGDMTPEQIEVIYIYSKVIGSVQVTKVDSTTDDIVPGATFKLEKLDNTDNVDTTFNAVEVTTDKDGIALFENLEVGKYQLTEIKAPEGYELMNKVEKVEITKAKRDVEVRASNRPQFALPATGAINYTIGLIAIGAILITSSVLLVKKSKKEVE